MISLRTGYRILITQYGYYGSISQPYVMYEIIERDGKLSDLETLVDTSLESYSYSQTCNLDHLNVIEKLEHLIIAIQNKFIHNPLICLHDHLSRGLIRRIPEKLCLLLPLLGRVLTGEVVDFTLESIQNGDIPILDQEFQQNLLDRLSDDFVSKIVEILNLRKLPIHDIEDDSRLIALGEGPNCIVIQKTLQNQKLRWIKYPFPELDLDEIDHFQIHELDVSNLTELNLHDLESSLSESWQEFSNLLEFGKVPKHLISGTNGKTTTARMIAHIIRNYSQKKMGLTSTSGIFIDDEEPDYGDFTGPWSARQLLLHPVEEVVLETARGGLIREGVIFEEVETATLTNVAADHIGLRDITTIEQMGDLKSLIFQAATKAVVLNIHEPILMGIFEKIKTGKLKLHSTCKIWGISSDNNLNPEIHNYVYLDRDSIYVQIDGEPEKIGSIDEFPFSDYGIISFMNINALSALAATIGYGIPTNKAYNALLSFAADATQSAGRGNFIKQSDRYFMLDYGHNPHALIQIKQTIENIQSKYPIKRTIFLALTAGDRRDEDLAEYGRILSTFPIDIVVFKDLWVDLRGKASGEVGAFVAQTMTKNGYTGTIYQKPFPIDAIQFCLDISESGDLLYLCAEKAQIMIQMIQDTDFSKKR